MLHELLLALSGYPGSIFVETEHGKIEMVDDVPFINPSEVALLSRLCRLASHYHYYKTFIAKYGHSPKYVDRDGSHGLYMKALCQGLDSVLQPYRQKLLDLEQQLMSDPHLTAAMLQSQLEEYQMLFPALTQTLQEIVQLQAHGCYILEILHKSAMNGIPCVMHALHRLLHICHGVMYKQLSAWMLHGMLLDKYNEFFIQQEPRRDDILSQSLQVEDDLGLGGVTGRQMQQIMNISEVAELSHNNQFSIHVDKLPSYIPTRIANKILFVGESVQLFESGSNSPATRHTVKGWILRGQEDAFSQDLHHLSQLENFHLVTFETTIDKIRSFAAEKLWSLIVEESDLTGNLHTMKDFYLLGRGELYLAFIDQAHSLLRTIPKGTTEHDVNMAFQHAARDVLFDDEKLLQRFHLTVAMPTGKKEQKKDVPFSQKSGEESVMGTDSGWNSLQLQYEVQWPLHVLFTPSILDRYNRILHFLLHVKRVQHELQHCWALQMQRKHLRVHGDTNAMQWWLRNHMAFLIDNLQYYLQVDVIECQFSLLLEKIQNTRDFEEIRLSHDTFLTSLLSQSFQLMKPIAHCLNEIFQLCHQFYGLMMASEATLTDQQLISLNDINKSFQLQSSLLFRNLSSVRSHQSSPYLAQLLLRIDYNKYYTVSGGQLGSYNTVGSSHTSKPVSRRN